MHEIVLRFEIMKNIAIERTKHREKQLKQHWSLKRLAEEVGGALAPKPGPTPKPADKAGALARLAARLA